MPASELATVALTLKLAAVTTVLLLLLCLPLAWWLASGGGRWRHTVMAVAALPLVLPPTVLGFYLLLWMAPGGWLGDLALWLRQQSLAFTFEGLVIGSLVYSLPFAVFPLRNAFLGVPRESLDAASTLGAGPLDRFFTVALPLSRPGLAAAAIRLRESPATTKTHCRSSFHCCNGLCQPKTKRWMQHKPGAISIQTNAGIANQLRSNLWNTLG